jgi:hypothetical protein
VVLSENELKALKEACLNELYRTDQRDWDVNAALKVIEEFVEFCLLLAKPENHIQVPTGQYVTQVATYGSTTLNRGHAAMGMKGCNFCLGDVNK